MITDAYGFEYMFEKNIQKKWAGLRIIGSKFGNKSDDDIIM